MLPIQSGQDGGLSDIVMRVRGGREQRPHKFKQL